VQVQAIKADYLVVGAGAMGMAFTDTLVAETDARVVLVDRGHAPGGHWTRAYPFVRLHQPSAYYGVNSRALGSDTIDHTGWNQGLYELATAGEVCTYFDRVMQHDLLPTGRVSYFPMSEYLGDGRFRTLGGVDYNVEGYRRVVDATYLQTVAPSMRPPAYHVAEGIECVPPNDLPTTAVGRDRYVIIGAGKTGIDVCLWLLHQSVAPERLTWIMPRDSWLLDRANIQPGPQFLEQFKASFAARLAAIEAATNVEDLFVRLEASGNLMRLDPTVRPRMYRCATVSQAELAQLRRIEDVVRMGRVQRLEPNTILLADGTIPTDRRSVLHIDCSADGLERRPPRTVFDGKHITLQSLRGCQQVFSAALIAHVEASYHDDESRNNVCIPVPHPNSDRDWLEVTIIEHRNQSYWLDDAELMNWLHSARLDLLRHMSAPLVHNPRVREKSLPLVKAAFQSSIDKLRALLDDQSALVPSVAG
jgi:hypothetical protein